MTPERWKQVEELYHAAQSRPAHERSGFVREACRRDEALRLEVEALLNEPVSADAFLDRRLPIGIDVTVEFAPPPMTGRVLGGYRLDQLLGAGGMGEVYGARDAKLDRDVAIKILPRAMTGDPERLARFEREARMLAALNHTNICAIYGLEEADGVRFLILERVDGTTLAERIQDSGPLPIDEALAVARQIAEALEAAHEKGIVHRDLKPANIKIASNGVVKVLDFGLAKPVNADGSDADPTRSPAITVGGTRDGVILGTAAYMSPEQARGKPIDKRTDIWAFGCVFYEMLTGLLPFPGETVSDTIGRILEREPDWTVLPVATPAPIRRLLRRCFVKDAKQRLRDVGDVRLELDAVGEEPSSAAVEPPAHRRRALLWLPWAILIATVAGGGLWLANQPQLDNRFAGAQLSHFTDWPGVQGRGELSPDGKFVAFLADRDGEFDIWWSQVGTDRWVNLTADVPPLDGPRTDSLLRTFGFSEDGSEIWFAVGDASAAKFIRPLSGGPARPFLSEGTSSPAWSPDGSRMVYFANDNDKDDPLIVADRSGGDARPIDITPGDPATWREAAKGILHNHNPVWSPDGQWIYFTHGLDPSVKMEVWRVSPSGGTPERLTTLDAAITFLTLLDSNTLLFVARPPDRSGPWLFSHDVQRRTTRRVSWGLEQYTSVAASRDGRRVVATVANPATSLWQIPLLDRPAEDNDAHPYPVPTPRAMAPRFAGSTLFYLSAHGTNDGLWRVRDGQGYEVRAGRDGDLSEPVAASPDGGRVAVVIREGGKPRLSIMAADGTNARTLAPSIEVDGAAGQSTIDWSPDGQSIVMGGIDADGRGLLKIPVDGGPPVKLVAGQAANPAWSPDGNLIVYARSLGAGAGSPLLGIRPNGERVELPNVRVRPGAYRFLRNGSGLVYLPRLQALDFWLLDFATKATRPLSRLSNQGTLRTFDITPDGKSIVFDRARQNSDIVLIDLPSR